VPNSDSPNVVLSGSLAFDYIMTFPGSFGDHILPEKAHVLSVSFLFDSLQRLRGGIAGNIAYSLALLGERPAVIGAGGADFADYRAALEQLGVDLSHVVTVDNLLTGSSFMQSDLAGNQIAGFYPGASVRAADLSITPLARGARFGLVGATTLEAMRRHADEIADAGANLIYDPSQQCVSLSAEDLNAGIDRAWMVVGSDYEFAMIERKTGRSVADIAARVPVTVVTFGAQGSEIHADGAVTRIPIAPPQHVVDPTGGGDAYRAGLIKGLLLGLPLDVCGRMGALSATYAIEKYGTQEHTYTPEAFLLRFDSTFPESAGAVPIAALGSPAPRHD